MARSTTTLIAAGALGLAGLTTAAVAAVRRERAGVFDRSSRAERRRRAQESWTEALAEVDAYLMDEVDQ